MSAITKTKSFIRKHPNPFILAGTVATLAGIAYMQYAVSRYVYNDIHSND